MLTNDKITGCLLGTAIGDALGLPFEGLSRQRLERMQPDLTGYHLVIGRGMVSDDTEHACMVAQSLITSRGDVSKFSSSLGWHLRFWLLGLPAGIGMATGRAIFKLLVGFPPSKSGVWSAGNGPAMRSPVIGVAFGHDSEKLRQFVHASTLVTHSDPKAEYGALAVAQAAWMQSNSQSDASVLLQQLQAQLKDDGASEFMGLMKQVTNSIERNESTLDFAESLGLEKGVTGYIYNTVPVALHAWLSHPTDLNKALVAVISCGGDTDTVAAITGGIVGAGLKADEIPMNLKQGLVDWPLTLNWINRLGSALHLSLTSDNKVRTPRFFYPFVLTRNLVFLVIVLLHGFRRLLPPY